MLCFVSLTDSNVACSICGKEDCFKNSFVDTGCKKKLEKLTVSCQCGWLGQLTEWEVGQDMLTACMIMLSHVKINFRIICEQTLGK